MKNMLVGLLAWCAVGAAQIVGPNPGYVFDSEAKQVRPVRGIVGTGAYVDAGVLSAETASVSPGGSLAARIQQGAVELVQQFGSESAAILKLADAPEGAVMFAWSEDALAMASAVTRQAWIWRDLAREPRLAGTWDLDAAGGGINAVWFDGSRLVVAAKGGVYLATAEGVSRLAELEDAWAVTQVSADLYLLDRASGEIWQIVDYAGLAAPLRFAEVPQPVGMIAVPGALLVASRDPRAVFRFDLASRSVTETLTLDFEPTRLERLGKGASAFLNAPGAVEPLYVLDGGAAMAVSFVPAGREQ